MMQFLAFLFFGLLLTSEISGKTQDYSDSCELVTGLSGTISKYSGFINGTCWHIKVPEHHYITVRITRLNVVDKTCFSGYIEIKPKGGFWFEPEVHKFCNDTNIPRNITYNTNQIEVFFNESWWGSDAFTLIYHIETSPCLRRYNFRCSKHTCIHEDKVCDGVEDCEDGSDEIGCEMDTRITSIKGLNSNRASAINWLMKQRLPSYGWSKNTHRAITALYLSGGANFHGNNTDEELMVKQLELETVVALLRNSSDPLSVNDLSMYINALLVTCHNPSKFYGHDLVQILSERVSSMKSPSPASYLTLCNANYTFSESDVQKLFTILKEDSNYPFYSDIKAMAVMAINCMKNKRNIFYNETNSFEIYNGRVRDYYNESGEDDYEVYNQTGFTEVYTETVDDFTENKEYDHYELYNNTESTENYNGTVDYFTESKEYDYSEFYNQTDSREIYTEILGNFTESKDYDNYEFYNHTDSTKVYTESITNFTETGEDDYDIYNRTGYLKIYNETLMKFVRSQQYDGSFGNVYTTSLVIQALLSSGQEYNKKWNVAAAMKYLMSKLKSTNREFLSTTLSLPILNGKSLVDVGRVNCRKQRNGGDEVSDVLDKLGEKMQVKYSLYIGDEKDIVHTMYLRVPENSSAYDVMRVGQEADPKYKFQQTKLSGSMYVYEIAGITNDPEAGKFWILYKGIIGEKGSLRHYSESPDKVTLNDGNHLVMWYRTINY